MSMHGFPKSCKSFLSSLMQWCALFQYFQSFLANLLLGQEVLA